MAAQIASEALAERLIDWGVDTVFGLPGDGINGIMEGLRRHQDKLKFVLVHHEEAAAFMATAHAKATGQLGVCLATSGPGGIHLLNGLYDAKLDHVPVLAITGMQETALLGTGYQQEVALDRLYADVAEYDMMISNPVQIPAVVDLAIRTAYARRGVAHITVPNDIQVADADADPWQHVAPASAPKTAAVYLPPPGLPATEDMQRLADFLNEGKKIAILAGAGALHAREELLGVAEALDAPIVKTLPGKAAVPDDSPYTTGGIGLLGTKPSEELMEEIDTLLLVGTNFPYTKHLPQEVRCAQIEADPARAGARIPTTLPVVGDSKETLRALLPLLKPRSESPLLAKYQREMNAWRRKMAALEDAERDPIAPQYLMAAISELAADDAIRRSQEEQLRGRHRADERGVRAPFSDEHSGHASLGEIQRGGEARRLLLARRDERGPLHLCVEHHDPVHDRVLGIAARAAELSALDVALRGLLDRRDEPRLVVRVGAAQRIDERDVHDQARERRSSSTFTSAG